MSRRIMARVCGSVGVLGLTLALLAAPARADGANAALVTSVQLPLGVSDVQPGLGSMWALRADGYVYSVLYRIDAATDTLTDTIPLGYPAADLTVAYGSVWVTDWYGSHLYRYSPSGQIEAVIPVGSAPFWVHAAFGSIWTSNHHSHSMSRIDPSTNGVVARPNVCANAFRNGPQDFTWDSSYLYVGCSNITNLQRIDPATNAVRNLADFGRPIDEQSLRWAPGPLGGTVWNVTPHALLAFDILGSVRTRVPALADNVIRSLTRLDGTLWYVQHSHGATTSTITSANGATGATVSSFSIDGSASLLRSGYGYLWSMVRGGVLERIQVDAAT